MASVAVMDMSTFGNQRGRDVYHRSSYASQKAVDKNTAISIDQNFYGITSTDSVNAIGAEKQFELVKMNAVQNTADGLAGRLDISINGGTDALARIKVAELSASNAKFVASKLSADFGSSYTTAFTKSGSAVQQTFTTGVGNSDVSLTASGTSTSTNLLVTAASTNLTGEMTLQGDRLNWYQQNGASVKKSAANMEYIYNHGTTGAANTSTGNVNFNLDPQNVLGNAMLSGGYTFNTFDSTGAAKPVLTMSAGATGTQAVQFQNSTVGIGAAPGAGFSLDVAGDSRIVGSLTVSQNLYIEGTTTTVDAATVQVEDKNIALAYNVADSTLFNGGGITVGSGDSAVTLNYLDSATQAKKVWDSSIGFNAPASSAYSLGGGYSTTADTGITLDSTGLYFGLDSAKIQLGSAATIDANGLAAASDGFAVTFGTNKDWKIQMQTIGGASYLAMLHSSDAGVSYVTKFSVGSD